MFYIQDEKEETLRPQVPVHYDLGQIPALISISDQGPSNTAALNFLLYSPNALLIWSIWDPYHRAWNDIKLALFREARPMHGEEF